MSFYMICFCLLLIFVPFSVGVIVCPNLKDYFFYSTNKLCHNNPDGDAENPSIIIQRHGFNSQTYNITTDDGYFINVERLYKKIEKKTPIIIAPGIQLNSFGFTNRGNKSLAFFLANHGYQVWIIDWRGTRFSRKHKNLSSNSQKYWNTGLDEMSSFDLKSVLKEVFAETKNKAIYVGYSMGTTIGLINSITEQKSAEKTLKGMVHMAPIAEFNHSRSILKYFHQFWPLIKPFFNLFHHGEIQTYRKGKNICGPHPFQVIFCELLVLPVFGNSLKFLDPLTYPITFKQNRDSITIKTIDHYYQIMKRKRFVEFSYGKIRNTMEYSSIESPPYDLRKISIPQSFLVGERDILATPKDTKNLYDHIPESSKCGYIIVEDYGHRDFISAKNVEKFLFGKVLKSIEKLDNGKCN